MSDEVAALLYAAGARYRADLPGDMADAVRNRFTIWLKKLIESGTDILHPVEDNRTPLQLVPGGEPEVSKTCKSYCLQALRQPLTIGMPRKG